MTTLRTGNTTTAAQLERDGERWRAILDSGEHEVDVSVLGPGEYHLTINGKAERVHVVRRGRHKLVWHRGRCITVAEEVQTGAGAAQDDTMGDVTPPMPAVVVRILVEPGEQVTKGQGLVVLSAMKMETTLVAPRDGEVEAIQAEEGASVAPGDVLVTLAEEDDGAE